MSDHPVTPTTSTQVSRLPLGKLLLGQKALTDRSTFATTELQNQASVRTFWSDLWAHSGDQLNNLDPFERACLIGIQAPCVGYSTLGGHQAAIRHLTPEIPWTELAAFCASETGGAHPKAIETRLEKGASTSSISGEKKWATLSPDSDHLLVVVSEGWNFGRNQLRLATVKSDQPGVTIEAMPITEFTPQIRHATIQLTDVEINNDAVLDLDGYLEVVKPFRTLEDLRIAAGVLSYCLGIAMDAEWGEEAVEELLAVLESARSLADHPASEPTHHLALAGWNRLRQLIAQEHTKRGLWDKVDPAVRDSYARDTAKSVAQKAKELRRQAAWRRLSEQ